jgi:hypothetical protein
MGFDSAPRLERVKEVKNRVFELIDNHFLDNQVEAARNAGYEKRVSLLVTKQALFEGFIVDSLAHEFFEEGVPEDFLKDEEFRNYVAGVSKERLVAMLEVQKMRFEEAIERVVDEDLKAHGIGLVDAANELIAELER